LGGFDPVTAVANGYAFIIQDVRGRWASEGEYVPISRQEGPDGYDCIEWVAAQPWCDRNVGMVGVSYESLAQWMAAEEQPPHLRAITPEYTGDSRSSFMRLDSIMVAWAASQAADWIRKKIADGKATPDEMKIVVDAMRDPQAQARYLPLDEMPLMKVGALFTYAQMIDLLRKAAGICWERIQVPALMISGWYDIDPFNISRFFASMKSSGGTDISRKDTVVVWGPWEHGVPFPNLGERFFGLFAAADTKQMANLYVSFFDRHLRSRSTTVPTATYFVMGINEWREADSWPPAGAVWAKYYLDSKGDANSLCSGRLVKAAPQQQVADKYDYDPMNPVPSLGGRHYRYGGTLAGPYDQRRIEVRPDVLVYTSDQMVGPLEMIGDCRLRFYAATSAADTDFVAKVCDVDPSGLSHNITDGILRAKWRNGFQEPELLQPGRVYEFVIELGPIGHVFLPGHRVRVQITSSSFPGYDRNMNTGNREGSDVTGVIAHQEIWHGGQRPSCLELQTTNP
jgi:putative CocE/NonD family hydrolase